MSISLADKIEGVCNCYVILPENGDENLTALQLIVFEGPTAVGWGYYSGFASPWVLCGATD
jgi:hypothetical protein